MIRLTEIKLENDIISCVVMTVEMNPRVFKVAYNLTTEEVVENTLEKMGMSVGMAIQKLKKLYADYGDNLPKCAESAWY